MRVVPFRCHRHHLVRLAVVTGLMALAASTGCSSGTNVTVQATLDSGVAGSDNRDPSTDGWSNANLTPTGFAMGIQSATLTSTTTTDSATIFDQGAGQPLFTRLYNSPTKIILGSQQDIANGAYDRLKLQAVFYEAAIQVADATTTHTRRLRYYFSDATDPLIHLAVTAGDLLLSNDDFTVPVVTDENQVGATGTDLRWIDQTDGSLCTPRSSCTGNTDAPYQGDASFLATLFTGYPTVTIPISTITVDSSTDTTFTIDLTVGTKNLLFYDETDSGTTPFNYLSSSSLDGKIESACSDPSNCSTSNPKEADFWIGPPLFSAAVTSQ